MTVTQDILVLQANKLHVPQIVEERLVGILFTQMLSEDLFLEPSLIPDLNA